MKYTVALGMRKGELYPPYSPFIPKSKIIEFEDFLKDKKIFKCGSNRDAETELNRLYKIGIREVQIVGAWAQWCVAFTVIYALRKGMIVHVPLHAVINTPNSTFPDLESTVTYVTKHNTPHQRILKGGIQTYTPW